MRIIGGALRGRRLSAPIGGATRPTADRVRQALFDSLAHAGWAGPEVIEGARVLDAFAGTGALGLEALSRGAAACVFFETNEAALLALTANIAACRLEDRVRVVARDATRPPPGLPCELVFLDPPYAEGRHAVSAVAALAEKGWIAPAALLVVETAARAPDPSLGILLAELRHGAARISFIRRS
ncbi:MAG: 16S rRNA (guanine(966)-N(2))-methyltransferase RsmD [Acetobacteraceae bacterium]